MRIKTEDLVEKIKNTIDFNYDDAIQYTVSKNGNCVIIQIEGNDIVINNDYENAMLLDEDQQIISYGDIENKIDQQINKF